MYLKQCGLNKFRPVEQKLRLNEFKTLQKAWSRGIPWWDYLVFAFLWWLEEKIIDYRVKTTVDEAIKEVEMPPMPDMVTPVYTVSQRADSESPSKTSVSLPEMRLTAPWYVGKDSERRANVVSRSEPPEGL